MANDEEKREMMKIVTSNWPVRGRSLDSETSVPFRCIVTRHKDPTCPPERATPRTLNRLLSNLSKLEAAGQLPDLSKVFDRHGDDTEEILTVKE